jgi:hypothetical protein
MGHSTRYLNTDLVLESAEDLRPLAAALEQGGLLVLHVDRRDDGAWLAVVEASLDLPEPAASLAALLDVVEPLDPALRLTWDRCAVRAFDVGYQVGDGPWGFTQAIPPALLVRVAALGAELRVTVYPAEPPSRPPEG